MDDKDCTERSAHDTGLRHGLNYVYMGNVPECSNTNCYNCRQLLIHREYFTAEKIHVKNRTCAACFTPIDGVWK